MFYPLYPIGIGAEWWLLYRAIGPAGEINRLIPSFFYFCLVLYIPGKWIFPQNKKQTKNNDEVLHGFAKLKI
jgi:hypothetical protein